jgi:hypothetical protein
MAALVSCKTNKKGHGRVRRGRGYKIACNLPGNRRTPRINSHTTAQIDGADSIFDVGVELCHGSCAPFVRFFTTLGSLSRLFLIRQEN